MLWFKEMCLGVKFDRGGFVMINLDVNLSWIEAYLRDKKSTLNVCEDISGNN
jgi:hypothetical protein